MENNPFGVDCSFKPFVAALKEIVFILNYDYSALFKQHYPNGRNPENKTNEQIFEVENRRDFPKHFKLPK
jgi:hypothetical protein